MERVVSGPRVHQGALGLPLRGQTLLCRCRWRVPPEVAGQLGMVSARHSGAHSLSFLD